MEDERFVEGQCVPCGAGGGGGPEPEKEICGPDITALLDLSLSRVATLFYGWSFLFREAQCELGWWWFDFEELYRDMVFTTHCPRGTCFDRTVQVGTGCYPDWAVNWSLLGALWAVCGYAKQYMFQIIAVYTVPLDLILWIENRLSSNPQSTCYTPIRSVQLKRDWAYAGYDFALSGNLIAPPPTPAETAGCAGCAEKYSQKGPFRIQWGLYSEWT